MEQNIPKIIHYSWFGGKEKSELIKSCISTWEKYLPGYEIKEWNESNFDLSSCTYVKEAYEAGKYAFVSDYVRVYTMYHYGGIYFDTDIEVRRNFDDKLQNAVFVIAFELQDALMTGFFAAASQNAIVKEILDYYEEIHFYNEDGSMKLVPNPVIFTEKLMGHGLNPNGRYQELEGGIKVYPNEVFGAYNVYDLVYTITDQTVLVHHYTASWKDPGEKALVEVRKFVQKTFGMKTFHMLRNVKHGINKIVKRK